MNIDLGTLISKAGAPWTWLFLMLLLMLGAYLADCLFSSSARR